MAEPNPPQYSEAIKLPPDNPVPDDLPGYTNSPASPISSQTYSLTLISPKTASLTPTSLSSITSPPPAYYTITYAQPLRPFSKLKATPDILIARSLDLASSSVSLASVKFDSTSSSTSITYSSAEATDPTDIAHEKEITLSLTSPLLRSYTAHISSLSVTISPDPAASSDFLIFSHPNTNSTPWARFRAAPPFSPPSQSSKRGLLKKITSPSTGAKAKEAPISPEELGTLEIYRQDADEAIRDQIVTLLITVVERTHRMRLQAGTDKQMIPGGCSSAAASAAT